MALSPLAPLYLKRLGLNKEDLDDDPTTAKLFAVVEAHLAKIPFENLSQHCGEKVVLGISELADKILKHNRGGTCLELNGLLGALLEEWGYDVNRVPARAFRGGTFEPTPTQMVLIVTTPPSRSDESLTWFVDVGSGEPALNPLFYEVGGMEQKTVGGIMSRFVHSGEENVALEWYNHNKDKSWTPRLLFNEKQADVSVKKNQLELKDFNEALKVEQAENFTFSQVLVACRLTRQVKLTLMGNRLKRTGPPRFSDDPPVVETTLDTVQQLREVLQDEFGVPLEETEGLDLTKSLQTPETPMLNEF